MVQYQVSIDRRTLEAALRQLVQHAQAVAWGRAGVNRTPRLTELLCWELRVGQTLPLLTTPAVVLTLGAEGSLWLPEPQGLRRWRAQHPPTSPVALLTLEQSPHRGTLTATWFSPGRESAPVHSVKIVGAGMHRIVTMAG
jgi:hypothetical protein